MLGGVPEPYGVLFRATLNGDVVPVHDFDYTHGGFPNQPLLQHTDGMLYGDTTEGGRFRKGVLFGLNASLPPFVSYLPTYGRAGAVVQILGQGFTGESKVFFNGTPGTIKALYSTFMKAIVPEGATTGRITVTTANGTLTSNKVFIVHSN